jgi:hypothetical protein
VRDYALRASENAISERHDHVHVLRHVWSFRLLDKLCWSHHLNCGRPKFRSLIGLYVNIFFRVHLPFLERDISAVVKIRPFAYLD